MNALKGKLETEKQELKTLDEMIAAEEKLDYQADV